MIASKEKPSLLGKAAYYLFPMRRKTVRDNLRIVFGDQMPKREMKTLHQCFYSHLLSVLIENIAFLWYSPERIKNKVDVIGYEKVLAAAEKKRGILLLTGHFGNWEMGPIGGILQFDRFKGRFHILRKNLMNKVLEKALFGRFEKAGLNVIPKKNSLDQVLAALAKNDVVVFVMDQYAKPGRDGILVDFFGKQAGTFRSLALVARATDAPVVPMVCYRKKDGRHALQFFDPLPWKTFDESDREIYENTRQYNEVLENFIIAHPEQWLWSHRRWKVKR